MAFGFPSALYSTEVELGVDRKATREAIRATLLSIGWLFENPHPDIYVAKIPLSGLSWGETLTIRFLENGTLEVESRCSRFLQLFDWGKNKKNVEIFLTTLTAKTAWIGKLNSLVERRFDTSQSTPLERVLSDMNEEP